MKKNMKINEQSVPMTEDGKFKKAVEFGCIPKWLVGGKIGNYQGKRVFFGKNGKNETVVFYADMTAENLSTNKKVKWSCPQLEQTVGKETNPVETLTPDQQSYINDIIKLEGVVQVKPSDYETNRGKWEVIDLNTKNPKLFPTKGTTFVYKQKGAINAVKPQQEIIIKAFEDKGWKRDQPNANESELYVKVDLKTVENGKYSTEFSQPFFMYQPVQDVDVTSLLQNTKNSFKSQDVEKSQCRKVIDLLYTANAKNYKMEDTERISYINYAKKCSAQGVIPMFSKKKYEELSYLNPQKSKYSLKEGKNALEKVIKENLIKVKSDKTRVITEESKIISKRFNILIEGREFKTTKQKEKLYNELLSEMVYLNKQGFNHTLINEGLWDMLKGLFGNGAEGIMQTFKEYVADWMVDKLTPLDSKGWIGGVISTTIGNLNLSDIPKLTDCDFTSKLLSKSVAEEAIKQLKNKTGLEGKIYDVLRNSIIETFEDSQLGQKLEAGIGNIICPLLGGLSNKIDSAAEDLKTKVVS